MSYAYFFFLTFPIVLVDDDRIIRVDIPFRRVESKYSIEQISVNVEFTVVNSMTLLVC